MSISIDLLSLGQRCQEDCGFVALQTRAVSNVIEFDHLERAQFRTKGQKCDWTEIYETCWANWAIKNTLVKRVWNKELYSTN